MSQKTAKEARKQGKVEGLRGGIRISQEELWGFNALDGQVRNVTAEVQRLQAARDSYIGLLELKYDAVFNVDSGTLEPKPKPEEPKEK